MNRLTGGQITKLILLPPIAAAAVYGVVRLIGYAMAYWQLWVLAQAVLIAFYLVTAVRDSGIDAAEEPARAAPALIKDRPFAEVNRWEERLTWGQADAERFRHTVQRRTSGIIIERLRLRHGVVLSADPRRAREILGEGLYRFATEPVQTSLSTQEMDYVVHCIEEI